MDDGSGLGSRNWGYPEPSHKSHLNLQLMPTARDIKPFVHGRNSAPVMVGPNGGFYHMDCGVSELPTQMDCVRDWRINQRAHVVQVNHNNYPILSETPGNHIFQMLQQADSSKDEKLVSSRVVEEGASKRDGPLKKRTGGRVPKSPKAKKPKRVVPKDETNPSVQRVRPGKRSMGVVINGIDMDISGIPIPVCSCTGNPQQCYRWGCGGWQSACCTTSISTYPLPMSTKRRGARIAGRKMSLGAFTKVLEKLAGEGYNLSNPIDLRTHWAKHGTNKFVTIR